MTSLGLIALLGSGETSTTGGQVLDQLVSQLPEHPSISVLETPAGFEPNSSVVAGRVADFIRSHLQNQQPSVALIAARRKVSETDPGQDAILEPLYTSDLIFLGPGSPTYAVRHLDGSPAWQITTTRQRHGAALVLASAAAIASGALALPVYEIYKVGEDIHWKPGLDYFAPYGLHLVIIPHWNNNEGGSALDTSRCFMGKERFSRLLDLVPNNYTVLGLDEHTGIILDLPHQNCRVIGKGAVHVLRDGSSTSCPGGCEYPIQTLGNYHPISEKSAGIPAAIFEKASLPRANQPIQEEPPAVPAEVQALFELRQVARAGKNWGESDRLRQVIAGLGWSLKDTPDGPQLIRLLK